MGRRQPFVSRVAGQIDAYLRMFEDAGAGYVVASARTAGDSVRVVYRISDGPVILPLEEAHAYLRWLEAGNVGTHLDMTSHAA